MHWSNGMVLLCQPIKRELESTSINHLKKIVLHSSEHIHCKDRATVPYTAATCWYVSNKCSYLWNENDM